VRTGNSAHPELSRRTNRTEETKHIDITHHFKRELRDKKELDLRFKRSENKSADIMTKNTTRDVHGKYIQQIRDGSLPFWKEDVKQDSSATEFSHSQIATQYSPVHTSTRSSYSSSTLCKSRTSKEPLESKVGSQSTSGDSEEPLERYTGSQGT
jgi:hypothetical protein